MDKAMMQEIIEHAVSFPGLRPPAGAREQFREKRNGRTYIYYRDDEGGCFYDTEEGQKFKRKMAEAERQQRSERMRRIIQNGEVAPVQQPEEGGTYETPDEMACVG